MKTRRGKQRTKSKEIIFFLVKELRQCCGAGPLMAGFWILEPLRLRHSSYGTGTILFSRYLFSPKGLI